MTVRIAIAGAGLIGSRHAQALANCRDANLAAIVDPASEAARVAAEHNVDHYDSLSVMLRHVRPDGIILATPNQLHVDNVMCCVEAGIPALVEKPLATTLEGAEQIVRAGKEAGVPLLTGHHRRHNPLIARAKAIIESGELGRITAAQGTTWFYKPDNYFDVDWRRQAGAGPVYINLIHDVDMLRHLCGEVTRVQAMESNVVRGYEVEDTAVILLGFDNGALATLSVSDTIAAPWSWELTARENPAYPVTNELCYQIGGTKGSLALPNLAMWQHRQIRSWWEPISATHLCVEQEDPLVRQIRQFAAVIRGDEQPLVSAEEGLRNQQVIEAVKQSARTGESVQLMD